MKFVNAAHERNYNKKIERIRRYTKAKARAIVGGKINNAEALSILNKRLGRGEITQDYYNERLSKY